MASNNQLSANTNVASNIVNEAAMAQSLHMVGNPPKPMARQYLQKKVDALNHPLGNTFVKLGGKDVDMRSYGKTTAADARKYNNGLSGEVELLDSDLDDFPPPPAYSASAAGGGGADAAFAFALSEQEKEWSAASEYDQTPADLHRSSHPAGPMKQPPSNMFDMVSELCM